MSEFRQHGVGRSAASVCLFVCLFVGVLKGKRLMLAVPKSVDIYRMAGFAAPRHALTLGSKGQRSNPNPKPPVKVLTFSVRWAGMRSNVSAHVNTFSHFSSYELC